MFISKKIKTRLQEIENQKLLARNKELEEALLEMARLSSDNEEAMLEIAELVSGVIE